MLENFLLFIEPFVEMLILKYICMSVKKNLRFIQKGPIFLFQTSENLVRGTKPVDGPAKLLGRFLSLTTKTWQLALLGKRISSVELSVATWLELKAWKPFSLEAQETGDNKH